MSPQKSGSKQLKYPACSITLAGFMLDDESSVSCCWASRDRAESLCSCSMKLHKGHSSMIADVQRKLRLKVVERLQNILDTVMNPNALQLLHAELKELRVAMLPAPNVWITEVGCLNSLNEARNMLDELRI